jgi:hypothetical protein
MSGLRMRLVPFASEAIATARIVCDFEPGICTTPDKQDVFTVKII